MSRRGFFFSSCSWSLNGMHAVTEFELEPSVFIMDGSMDKVISRFAFVNQPPGKLVYLFICLCGSLSTYKKLDTSVSITYQPLGPTIQYEECRVLYPLAKHERI